MNIMEIKNNCGEGAEVSVLSTYALQGYGLATYRLSVINLLMTKFPQLRILCTTEGLCS